MVSSFLLVVEQGDLERLQSAVERRLDNSYELRSVPVAERAQRRNELFQSFRERAYKSALSVVACLVR